MRNHGNRKLALIHKCVAVLMMLLTLPSCSVIGLATGAMVDQSTSGRYHSAEQQALFEVARGTPVHVTLADSTRVEGSMDRVTATADAAYHERYATWRSQRADSAVIPALGDVISVASYSRLYKDARFDGLVRNDLQVSTAFGGAVRVPLSEITELRTTTPGRLMVSALRDPVSAPPRISTGAVTLTTTSGPRTVPVTEVAHVEVVQKHHTALTFLLVGAAMDLAFGYVILRSDPFFGGGPNR